MKKIFILGLGVYISSIAYAQDVNSLVNYEISKLQANGCSVNQHGVIVNEISTNKYKVLIPYIDCNGDGKFEVLAGIYSHKSGDRWIKEPAGDTNSEKITDYNGMASITERIEYTAPYTTTTTTTPNQ